MRNGGQTPAGDSCSSCGKPVTLKRVDAHYVVHEIQHILHFEKGIFYTVRQLLLRPGRTIRHFLSEDRSRLVKPVLYIILTSFLYTLIAHSFQHGNEHQKPAVPANSAIIAILNWIDGHYGYANIIMGMFIGCWLNLMTPKNGYNFFEHLIMLCFVMGTGMLIYALFTLITGITKTDLMLIGGIITAIYCLWGIGQFLNARKFSSYVLAMVAYMLGILTAAILVVVIGITIDWVVKS